MRRFTLIVIYWLVVAGILLLPVCHAADSVYLSSTSKTSSSVSLSWSKSGDWLFETYTVEYRPSGGSWRTHTTISNIDITTARVTGLSSGTTYQFRVRDDDSISSAYSNTISVTTDSAYMTDEEGEILGMPLLCLAGIIVVIVIIVAVGVAASGRKKHEPSQEYGGQYQYVPPQPQPAQPVQQPAPSTPRFCPNCAKPNDGWKHCPDCGTTLTATQKEI